MNDSSTREHSFGEILSGLASDLQSMVRGEISLARIEFGRKLHALIVAAVTALGGALVAFAGLVVFLQGVAAALALAIPLWAALFIVGAIIIIVGGVMARAAWAKMSLESVMPERTAANLRSDAAILKEHI